MRYLVFSPMIASQEETPSSFVVAGLRAGVIFNAALSLHVQGSLHCQAEQSSFLFMSIENTLPVHLCLSICLSVYISLSESLYSYPLSLAVC